MGVSRRGHFTLLDVLMLIVVVGGMLMLIPTALVAKREEARRNICHENLKRISTALEQHHHVQGAYPPAAIQPNSRATWMLKNEQEQMVISHANWAISLLPYLGEEQLATTFHRQKPISDPSNAKVRIAELPWMKCPDDKCHRPDNPFRCVLNSGKELIFARGNYAINAGSSSAAAEPGDPNKPVLDGVSLLSEGERQVWWGNGIAGINKSFSKKDMVNGLATTVAVDEIRTGLAPIDSRGSWALGQIGCSITFGHGVYSDATGPNCRRLSSDRTIGALELGKLLGRQKVVQEGMPCVFYFYSGAAQATARSMHPGGVNVLMLDGSIHFVSDLVDLNVWHAIHSRKTRERIPVESFDRNMPRANDTPVQDDRAALDGSVIAGMDNTYLKPLVASCGTTPTPRVQSIKYIENSIGMKFAELLAGKFVMGLPDEGRRVAYQTATPAHVVHITKPFYMGVYSVTQREYRQVMKKNPSWQITVIDDGKDQPHNKNTDWYPVEQVSWYDAVEFCRQLSNFPAEKLSGRQYRLPTEAEWEYACRAGSTEQGNDRRLAHSIGPVNLDKPNAFGVCGMYTSVFEWCADGFSRYYYARSPENDPKGSSSIYLRVIRGSDWIFTKDVNCQLNSWAAHPSVINRYVGFRVVCDGEPIR